MKMKIALNNNANDNSSSDNNMMMMMMMMMKTMIAMMVLMITVTNVCTIIYTYWNIWSSFQLTATLFGLNAFRTAE